MDANVLLFTMEEKMTREERAYNYASKKKPSKFTVGEIAKHNDDGYSDGKKEVINKACEWLNNALYTRIDGAEHYVASKNKITLEEFVNNIRKAMEE